MPSVSALAVRWNSHLFPDTRWGFWIAGALLFVVLGVMLATMPLQVAVAGFVLVVGLIVLLVQPVLGLVLLALVIPFSQQWQITLAGIRLGIAEVLLAMTVAVWLARCAARREIRIGPAPLLVPFLLLIGIQSLTLVNGGSFRSSLPEVFKWVEMLVVYLLAASEIEEGHVPWVLGAMLLAATLQAALGGYQFMRQVGPEAFVLRGRFMRAYGSFSQPNPFGGYLGMVAPLSLSFGLWATGRMVNTGERGYERSSPPPIRRLFVALLLLATTGAIVGGILMSWSRGAWLGVAAAVAIVFASRSARPVPWIVGLVLLVALLAVVGQGLLPDALLDRLAGLDDYVQYATQVDITRVEVTDANFAVLERVAHWKAAWSMFSERPWLGVGIGNYEAAYPAHAVPRWSAALGHAHNIYLHYLAETGLIGLIAYLILFVASITLAWRVRWESVGIDRAIAIGAIGMLAHLAVHNLVDNLYVQGIYLQVALVLGLLGATWRRTRTSKPIGSTMVQRLPDSDSAGVPSGV